jgi:hypothetical protein
MPITVHCGTPSTQIKEVDISRLRGVLVMDEGDPDDLAKKVNRVLIIILGSSQVQDLVSAATGRIGPADELLRRYLEKSFFSLHIKQYQNRPIYWLLQSPKKHYGIWIFHEWLDKNSLFDIMTKYVGTKIKHLNGQIAELREKRDESQGRKRRELEKAMADLSDVLEDVHAFQKNLDTIIRERGYRPISMTASSSTWPPSGSSSPPGRRSPKRPGKPWNAATSTGPTRPWTTGPTA